MNTPKIIDTIVAFILLRFKHFPTVTELTTKLIDDTNIVIRANRCEYARIAKEQYGAIHTAYNEQITIID